MLFPWLKANRLRSEIDQEHALFGQLPKQMWLLVAPRLVNLHDSLDHVPEQPVLCANVLEVEVTIQGTWWRLSNEEEIYR